MGEKETREEIRERGELLKIELRESIRKKSSRILYIDNRYLIGVSCSEPDAHHLSVNEAYAYLGRGILNELARADVERLKSSMNVVGVEVSLEMVIEKIPWEDLGWALAKVVIRDQENYVSHLVSEKGSSS